MATNFSEYMPVFSQNFPSHSRAGQSRKTTDSLQDYGFHFCQALIRSRGEKEEHFILAEQEQNIVLLEWNGLLMHYDNNNFII